MQPVRTLPPTYRQVGRLDLTHNLPLLLGMNIASLGLFIVFGGLFGAAALRLRPDAAGSLLSLEVDGWGGILRVSIALVVLMLAVAVLHEAAHGLFFWIYTASRPVFSFHYYYATASAPGWYIPKLQFMVIGLAPLVLLTLLGFVLLPFLPAGWLLPVVAFMTINASGAVGDLAVILWLLRQPSNCLALDEAETVTLFNQADETTYHKEHKEH
jgi:hypothetical protein